MQEPPVAEDEPSPMMPWLLPIGTILCILLGLPGAVALVLGIGLAFLGANTDPARWHCRAHWLLQASVISLGAGINLPEVAQAGLNGLVVTLFSIVAILIFGNVIGTWLKIPRHTRYLISAGTAICGGSAIAALAGVLKPRHHETAAALGIVFILNAVALVLFPYLGHVFHLSEPAFAWWAALAIHDTSSVVGAGMTYGPQALTLATTIKLARALWIIPVAIAFAYVERRQNSPGECTQTSRICIPWFILGFIALAGIRWCLPEYAPIGDAISQTGHHTLSAALFLIGAGLNPHALRQVGWRPALLGLAIWLPTSVCALLFVVAFH